MPTFTIMGSGIGYIGGNYKNDVPYLAAKKAGKALFKKLENPKYAKHKNRKSIKFVIRMKDRHSPGKTYSYQVVREKLKKPILIKVKNTEYYVRYNYVIKACDLSKKQKKILLGGNFIGGMTDEPEPEPESEPESESEPEPEPESKPEPESDDLFHTDDVDSKIYGGKKKKKKGGFFSMSSLAQALDTDHHPVPVNPTFSGGKNKKKGGKNYFYEEFNPDKNSSIEGGKNKRTNKYIAGAHGTEEYAAKLEDFALKEMRKKKYTETEIEDERSAKRAMENKGYSLTNPPPFPFKNDHTYQEKHRYRYWQHGLGPTGTWINYPDGYPDANRPNAKWEEIDVPGDYFTWNKFYIDYYLKKNPPPKYENSMYM